MNEQTKAQILCARCGGAMGNDFKCETCRSINGPVRGVLGENMPGAEWTDTVNLGKHADVRIEDVMRCAVVVGGEYGPSAFVQMPAGRWDAGTWVLQGLSVNADIFRAWGEAMLKRARNAEWVLDELAKRRQAPASVEERRKALAQLLAALPAPQGYSPEIMSRCARFITGGALVDNPLAFTRSVLLSLACETEHAEAARQALDALGALWAVLP